METYEITLKSRPDGPPMVVTGSNRDRAKYQAFLEADGTYPYFYDLLRDIASMKLIHKDPTYATEDVKERFARFALKRGISFAYIGMHVSVAGSHGVIMGSNSSANLNVLFDDGRVEICHPKWSIKYYSENGSIVASFPGM